MRYIPVGSIKEGSILARSVYSDKGLILLQEGVPLTTSLIRRLRDNQILGANIHDSYSNEEIQDIISPELRQRAVQEIHHVFQHVRIHNEKSLQSLENEKNKLSKRISLMVDQKYLKTLDDVVTDMITEITHNRDAMVGLVDIKSMESFVYQHSIQVTVLSLLIGASLKMDKSSLKDLAIAALLHDIGLTFIEPDLILYNDSFTDAQKYQYRSHCQLGYDFIKENTSLSSHVRMGILQHHEANNGNGFPLGLSGTEIHLNARIIHLANVYDKMSSGITGEHNPPNEIIEYIMGNSGDGQIFNFDIANLFVRRIIPFPIGTHVLLSNGKHGVVVNYNSSHPLRPTLKILDLKKKPEDLDVFNMIDHDKLNVTIKSVIYDD